MTRAKRKSVMLNQDVYLWFRQKSTHFHYPGAYSYYHIFLLLRGSECSLTSIHQHKAGLYMCSFPHPLTWIWKALKGHFNFKTTVFLYFSTSPERKLCWTPFLQHKDSPNPKTKSQQPWNVKCQQLHHCIISLTSLAFLLMSIWFIKKQKNNAFVQNHYCNLLKSTQT